MDKYAYVKFDFTMKLLVKIKKYKKSFFIRNYVGA